MKQSRRFRFVSGLVTGILSRAAATDSVESETFFIHRMLLQEGIK